MLTHRTSYRVTYGDTDQMGVAYYANYLRWFEIGRTEMFRALGLTYRELESRGFYLPVSDAYCKYIASPGYDDLLAIDITLDPEVRGGLKFDYRIADGADDRLLAHGYTRHAFVNRQGKVVRPPAFFRDLLRRDPDPDNGHRADDTHTRHPDLLP